LTTKIFTVAHVADDLAQAWLQHLRDFDTANPGCHFEVFADTPNASMADVVRLLQVEPGLTFEKFFGLPKEKP
jgi:hypothetical protein